MFIREIVRGGVCTAFGFPQTGRRHAVAGREHLRTTTGDYYGLQRFPIYFIGPLLEEPVKAQKGRGNNVDDVLVVDYLLK